MKEITKKYRVILDEGRSAEIYAERLEIEPRAQTYTFLRSIGDSVSQEVVAEFIKPLGVIRHEALTPNPQGNE